MTASSSEPLPSELASALAQSRHVLGEAAPERLAGLLDSAMDGILTIDARQSIVLYNRAAEQMFGWTAQEVLGQPLTMLLPARYREGHAGHVARFGATGVTSRRMGDGTVLHGLRRDGEEFPLEASISQLDTGAGHLFTVILRDVTERQRAQEGLREFAAQAHAIREAEKARVARELHDELAQTLTALKMDTLWLREHGAERQLEARAKLGSMLGMLDGAVAATRRIAADLRPLLLDDLGLGPAIDWLGHTFSQRSGVACVVDVDDELDMGEPYASAIFRIIQESLVNVGKHAQAREVRVSVVRGPRGMTLEVSDDGVGFDPLAPRKAASLGLMGLRERAQLLDGSVQVESSPGRGTRVTVEIPLAPGAGGRG